MGFGDRAWSGGLDQLATKLGSNGCFAHVEPYRKWKSIVKDIVRDRPEKLVLIWHSHGGVIAIKAARVLQEQGIAVRLLVLLDVGRPDPIPSNVDMAVHYYVVPRTMTFRSGPRDSLEPGNMYTQLTNVAVGSEGDVPAARDVDHLTISDSAAIHGMITDKMAAAGVS
jgi:thioesterase domain-containing protein